MSENNNSGQAHILDRLDYILVPIWVLLGVLGNTSGSLCILTNFKMRKRTPLFVLAWIGLSDTILLLTQLQRWLAAHLKRFNFLIISHTSCKFYFSLFHFSMLLSCSLTFVLVLLRFVSLYMGKHRLSAYSILGQMLSKLSVAYVLALTLSICWHNLWKSGLAKNQKAILKDEAGSKFSSSNEDLDTFTESSNRTGELRCNKNVHSQQFYILVDLFYSLLMLCLNVATMILSIFVLCKLIVRFRRPEKHSNETADKNEKEKQNNSLKTIRLFEPEKFAHRLKRSPSLINYSVQVNAEADQQKAKSQSLDKLNADKMQVFGKKLRKSFLRTNSWRAFALANTSVQLFSKLKSNQSKQFTFSILFISFTSGLLGFPSIILDFFYDMDALSTHTPSDHSKHMVKLAILLLNLPHCFKFYILFFGYSKYRAQIGRFLRIKFYINLGKGNNGFEGNIQSIKFIIMHQFHYLINADQHLVKQRQTREEIRLGKLISKFRHDDYDDETSSIVGYRASFFVHDQNDCAKSLLNLFEFSTPNSNDLNSN